MVFSLASSYVLVSKFKNPKPVTILFCWVNVGYEKPCKKVGGFVLLLLKNVRTEWEIFPLLQIFCDDLIDEVCKGFLVLRSLVSP